MTDFDDARIEELLKQYQDIEDNDWIENIKYKWGDEMGECFEQLPHALKELKAAREDNEKILTDAMVAQDIMSKRLKELLQETVDLKQVIEELKSNADKIV